ncbi:MAG: acyl-CoA dehydrogenase family protein [Lentisphaerae bacterium]|nr:acyl-CoA dehydrogenase family protein [Lentisphaerota bacterium]
MKTNVEAGGAEPAEVIDTSKMNEGKRQALELAESSREAAGQVPSFVGQLFMGRLPWELIDPYPEPTAEDRAAGDDFLARLDAFLRTHTDPDAIDRDGEIPQEVMDGLAALGAFGIKIPTAYGGLGLSQVTYSRAAMLLGSHCGNLTALLSAHQSIGVPQPLLVFGTDDQKRRYLPRVAAGELSAFALTEVGVGSDPARMQTHAEPTADGQHFVLNGEKLWCTNGTRAGVMVVMARTPPKVVNGKERNQITAFIVEATMPGVSVVHRCRFMGLRALYNGVIRFENVKVPRENILLAEGKGLRVALTTLNTGRLTLPSACVGLSKRCLGIVRRWAGAREQWGAVIGKHAAIADKIARLAADTFAMEAMTLLTAALVDRHQTDIRLEAAMCKMWGTERAWRIVDDTMQIRGGRGYETADSLRARGEAPIAVERFMRDSRINLIFEGSSEIMRLFIAREALDPHLKLGGAALNPKLPVATRLAAGARAAVFYAGWYVRQWVGWVGGGRGAGMHPALRRHARYAEATSRRLARALFHAMLRHGPKLEREQVLLGRLVDIGTDVFAIAATCARAQSLVDGGHGEEALALADVFCRDSRGRVEEAFRASAHNTDHARYRLAREVLEGKFTWLEDGILAPGA